MNPTDLAAACFEIDTELPLLDPVQLAEFKDTAPDDVQGLMREIANAFMEECEAKLELMQQAADSKDLAQMREVAHFISGSAANTGLNRLAELCLAVERQIDAGEFTAFADTPNLVAYEVERGLDAFLSEPMQD
ncbi:MAG: Hpt domain-containing protein [Verrucomicrobiota bacterium]